VPELDLKLPRIIPKPVVLPGVTPTTPVVGGTREVRAGETLSGIAKEAGASLAQILDLNPEFKANPNLIKPGQQIKLPGVAPAATPVVPPTTQTQAPTPTGATPPKTPAPTPIPGTPPAPVTTTTPATPKPVATPPTPASSYTGSSIVDYLKSVGQDSSSAARAKLATEKGIVKSEQEYLDAAKVGANAQFNEQLLKALRG